MGTTGREPTATGAELALFDFDHTITRGDTYARFLRLVATPEQRARAWWLMGPWLLALRLRLISAARVRARATRLVFTGRHAEDIARMAGTYARDELPGRVRPEMLEQIQWHRAQGHTVAVVSGSLDLYLRPWCQALGLQVLCNQLEIVDGRSTGRYLDRDIAPRKADAVRRHFDLTGYACIHAYGDSAEDRPMLALAHERWYRGKPVKR